MACNLKECGVIKIKREGAGRGGGGGGLTGGLEGGVGGGGRQ